MKFFKNLYNWIDFFLRRRIRFSRAYAGENESKDGLFNDLPEQKSLIAEEKESLYLKKYGLDYLKNNSTKRNYLENLAIVELLENYIQVDKPAPKILDIGSKNWFYARGQYNFFKHNNFEKNIEITGLEIDAFRVYSNLHTRYDYALYYTKGLENCRYIPGNLLDHQGKYDYITWFFPFVTEIPLLAWGLPLNTFKPLEMLEHAAGLLNSGGVMLIVNQDENEYSIQENLIKQLNLNYTKGYEFQNSFFEHEQKMFVTEVHSSC